MIINIVETITNTLNEKREILKTRKTEVYTIKPEEGKVLVNKTTGTIFRGLVSLKSEAEISNYSEIDDPALL